MHTDAQECTRTRMGKNNTTFGGKKTLHPSPSVASTPESQVARHHEIRSRRAQLMRAVRSGVIDCRSNAPEIALWLPSGDLSSSRIGLVRHALCLEPSMMKKSY